MKKVLKNHFIPHSGNEYQPHILQKAALGAMAILVLLSFIAANMQALFWISSDWMVSTILPAVIVAETNDERDTDALVPLQRNTDLDRAAQLKAEHMAANEYFAHFSPEGVSPWFWFGQVDYGFVHAGENLAIHFNDSHEVVEAWMDSPTHRANILNGDFREIGIGVAQGEYEGFKTLYVVQLFGTPAATAVATAPAPEPAPVAAASAQAPVVSTSEVAPTPEPPTVAVAGAEDEVVIAEDRSQAPVLTTPVQLPEPIEEPVTVTATPTPVANFVSTTTGGTPATININSEQATDRPYLAFTTQPQLVLQILYATIGLFVIGALLLAVVIEARRQHPVQIGYSLAMLLLMYGLYSLHTHITSGAIVV